MDERFCKSYQPTLSARALVIAFLLPCALLIGLVGVDLLRKSIGWGVVALLLAALLCIMIVHATTSRVTLTEERLTRTWQWGAVVIPVIDITKLRWSGGRGQLNLVVMAGNKWVLLSSLSFARQELHEMANTILAARGLEGSQSWPPRATYIDLGEMARQNEISQRGKSG